MAPHGAGYDGMLVHGRCRNSDAKAIVKATPNPILGEEGQLEGGFLEALALDTKTATSKEKKRMWLPHHCASAGPDWT